MSIAKKFDPFINYLSGAYHIRSKFTPTYCKPFRELFQHTKAKDIYIENLYEVMSTRKVSQKFNKFNNNTVSANWVTLHLDENLRGLNQFVAKIQIKTKEIEGLATRNGVDITENLTNIDKILEKYNNDPQIIKIKNHLTEKLSVVAEWDKAIQESVKKIVESAKRMTPDVYNMDYYQYDNDIDLNPDLASMKTFIDEKSFIFENNRTGKEPDWFDYSIVTNYIDELNKESIGAFAKIRNAGVELSMADKFLMEHQSPTKKDNITAFLQDKIKDEAQDLSSICKIHDFDSNRIKAILLFEDHTMLLKKDDNTYQDIFTINQLHEAKKIIVADSVRNLFKKNPTVAKNFIEIIEKDRDLMNLKKANVAIETYHNNLEFFNSKSFDIKAEFKTALADKQNNIYKAIEQLDDKMNKKIKDHKVFLFAHSISSNKYKNLYNEESYKIIESIYDLKLKTDVFQDYIGKKIAAYKTPEEFNEGLMKFVASFNSFEMTAMINKAEDAGARVISEADNILVVAIDSYEQSKLLGSSSWCIVRNESYFKSYTGNGNQQYFVFDFSKDSADEASMMGITLDRRGDYSAAHFKDDSEMEEDDDMICYVQEVVDNFQYKEKVNSKAKLNI